MHGVRVERKKDRVVKKRRGRKREKKTKFIIKVVWVERKASEIRPPTIRPQIKQISPNWLEERQVIDSKNLHRAFI